MADKVQKCKFVTTVVREHKETIRTKKIILYVLHISTTNFPKIEKE